MQYITSNTTLSTANTDIIIDASSADVKATLPLASTTTGIPFFIKCISVTNEARLTATGSSIGDGDFLFSFAGQQITVISDGSNYEIQSRDTDTLTAKIYRALLSQSGTDAPTAVVLENTLGQVPTFVYTNVGIYALNVTGNALTSNKTYLQFRNRVSVSGDFTAAGSFWYDFQLASQSTIQIYATRGDGVTAIDDALNATELTILIYP